MVDPPQFTLAWRQCSAVGERIDAHRPTWARRTADLSDGLRMAIIRASMPGGAVQPRETAYAFLIPTIVGLRVVGALADTLPSP